MPEKHPNTERIGGPGSSHENRQHPEKSQPRGEHPSVKKDRSDLSSVSGGGGESDRHHEQNAPGKAGR